MKLFIIDDSQVIRKVVRAVADALEMETEEACDGIEAIEKLEEIYKDIDLVLLDWNMPEKSGYELLVEIKKNEKYKDIPVMMVTTEGQKSNIVAAIRAGAANYLTKPFTITELETKILECLHEDGDYL